VSAQIRSNDKNLNRSGSPANQPALSQLSDYIIHSGNELAAGVAGVLAEGKVEGFSPLLLVGESGTGKTRTIEMMIAEATRRRPDLTISRRGVHDRVIR